MAKNILDFQITDNKQLKKDFFVLELFSPNPLPEILPGQFVQARIDSSTGTFLRRPFSVHDVDYGQNRIKILVQVAGKGTHSLSLLKKGDSLNLVFPLGNSFSLPASLKRSLLVGGGCGVAPMYFLGKYLKAKGYDFDILVGFRNRDRIIEYPEYQQLSRVFLTTEDGSEGEKGFVTQHSILKNADYGKIYCCGPDSMMKAVAVHAKKSGIDCEVSLENLMACGIGVCLCCVVNTIHGNLCSCTDGPVFNINDLKW